MGILKGMGRDDAGGGWQWCAGTHAALGNDPQTGSVALKYRFCGFLNHIYLYYTRSQKNHLAVEHFCALFGLFTSFPRSISLHSLSRRRRRPISTFDGSKVMIQKRSQSWNAKGSRGRGRKGRCVD